MIMQRRTLSIAAFFFLLLHQSATAQNADSLTSQISSGPAVTYSIQQCIDSALKNNLTVKSSEFTARLAEVTRLQQIGNALPTLSASAQYYNTGGKSVNQSTYTYVTENYNQAYGSLNGSVILFNGFSIQNFIRQYSLAYEADKKDWQYQKDLLTINIVLDYLSILSSEEQLDLAIKQAADIRHRTDLMSIQDSLGSIAPSAFTDQKALLNSAELTVVNTKNVLEQNKLKLAQDMNIPYSPNMDVVKINVDVTPVLYDASVDQVYQNATHNIASVQAAELHLASAKKGIQAARGNMAPTLYLFYGVGSNYSTTTTTTASAGTSYYQDGSYVNVNGTQTLVNYPYTLAGATKGVPFNTQFTNNIYTNLGLQLNIPILNRLSYRAIYKNAQIARDQAVFQQKTVMSQLRQSVESYYVTMTQNFRTYDVTYRQVQNYEESYREAKIKFDAGYISSLDFVIYSQDKNQGELNLIAAKYSYLLSTKVLDYFQGHLTW
jgi:outer membrane protein